MNSDDDTGIPPLNVADCKLRLKHGDRSEHEEAIKEITAYGAAAQCLMPLVVDLYRAGELKVHLWCLSRLYRATESSELLAALREKGALQDCSVEEKCLLLEHGVHDLEQDLRKLLFDDWSNPDSPSREEIVAALGRAGRGESLEMIEVIHFKLAAIVREQSARLAGSRRHDVIDPDVLEQIQDPIIDGDSLAEMIDAARKAAIPEGQAKRNSRFLQVVKNAILEMRRRGIEHS